MNKTAAQIADDVLEKIANRFAGVRSRANKAFGELDRATAQPVQAPKPAAVPAPPRPPAPVQAPKPMAIPKPAPTAMKPATPAPAQAPAAMTLPKPAAPAPAAMKPAAPAPVQPKAPVQAPAARMSQSDDAFSRLDSNVKKYPGGAIISRRTIGKPPPK